MKLPLFDGQDKTDEGTEALRGRPVSEVVRPGCGCGQFIHSYYDAPSVKQIYTCMCGVWLSVQSNDDKKIKILRPIDQP